MNKQRICIIICIIFTIFVLNIFISILLAAEAEAEQKPSPPPGVWKEAPDQWKDGKWVPKHRYWQPLNPDGKPPEDLCPNTPKRKKIWQRIKNFFSKPYKE